MFRLQLMELVPVSCTVRPSRAETPPPSLKRTKLEEPTTVPTAAYYSALSMAPTLPNYMVDPFHYFYGAWVPPPAAMYHSHLYRNDRYGTTGRTLQTAQRACGATLPRETRFTTLRDRHFTRRRSRVFVETARAVRIRYGDSNDICRT